LNLSVKSLRWIKVLAFLACLLPLARLGWKAYTHNLGANPIEVITHSTGDWILIFLLVTLAITPLRKLTGQLWLIRFRRMFGLFAFFYASLHFLTYIWLDKFFDVHEMLADVAKRRFITAGFTGFVLLIPLAITSTSGWIRRLGGRRWNLLHRLIYISAAAGVIHYLWLVKADIRKPLQYAAVLALLLGYRITVWARKRIAEKSHAPFSGPAVSRGQTPIPSKSPFRDAPL
jgi:methionine sulfoxide reductase heme-binding subunit